MDGSGTDVEPMGAPWSEDVFLTAGDAFEQRVQARFAPRFIPSLEDRQPGSELAVKYGAFPPHDG